MPRNPGCTNCPLHEKARTVCVWGQGPGDARIVIVGQNPGYEEDRDGTPFIGPSGRLLNEILRECGLDRSDVYVTNAVKCLTPGNRKPTPGEIKACNPYLAEELAGMRPKVIVPMGNEALKAVTGESGITKKRGQLLDFGEIPVVPTYHPAYALRAPQFLADIKYDMLRAASIVNPRPARDIKWSWGDSSEDPHTYRTALWAFDIETNGKPIYDPEFRIACIGIDDGRSTVVYKHPYVWLAVSRLKKAHDEGVRLFGHNSIAYDVEAICRWCGTYLIADDTLILAHLLDESVALPQNKGKGTLEALCVTHLGAAPWKAQVTWGWADVFEHIEETGRYNAEDIIHQRDLSLALVKKAREAGVERAYDVTRKAAIVFNHNVNRVGIGINRAKLLTLKDELRTSALDAQLKFEQIAGHEVNLGSWQQVGKVLYGEMGFHPHHYTSTGAPSTDELSVKNIALDQPHPILDALLAHRKNSKLISMLESFEGYIDENGRIHPEYSVTATVTGRTTAYNPPVQTWPHDPRVRDLLCAIRAGRNAPAEDFVLVEADYSQIEMRMAAEISGSIPMQELFFKGIDPHRNTAARMTGKPLEEVTSRERYVAKPVNFGLLYGADEYTLRKQALLDYDLVLSKPQAQRFHDIFHETYALEPWYGRIAAELRDTGCVRNPLGGIRHLPNWYSSDPRLRLEALRQGINYPVQSFATYLAFIALWECYRRGIPISAFIHDALYVECPLSSVDQYKAQLREVMTVRVPEILKSEYDFRLAIPLEVEFKVR